MGVHVIRDRATSRSRPVADRTEAFDSRSVGVIVIAACSAITLVVAAALGAVPLPGAAAIALLVPAAVVDVDERRLPDVWVVAALGALTVLLAVSRAFGSPTGTDSAVGVLPGGLLGGILGGAAAMALPVLALHLVSPASMGFGDVKAAGVLGAAVGTVDWRLGAVALCIAALSGAGVGVLTRRRTIAFGPFLVFGAWLALLAHEPLADFVLSRGIAP